MQLVYYYGILTALNATDINMVFLQYSMQAYGIPVALYAGRL